MNLLYTWIRAVNSIFNTILNWTYDSTRFSYVQWPGAKYYVLSDNLIKFSVFVL